MRRRAAGRHQRRAYAHLRHADLLQTVQRRQQRLERAFGQGLCGFFQLMLLKRCQPFALKHTLGLVREQHGVAVKGNAHFLRVMAAGAHGVGVDMGCGVA